MSTLVDRILSQCAELYRPQGFICRDPSPNEEYVRRIVRDELAHMTYLADIAALRKNREQPPSGPA